MKKIILIAAVLCLVFGAAACSQGSTDEGNTAESTNASTEAVADENGRYTENDVSYAVMAETTDDDMRITNVEEVSKGYEVGLIDATNTGDADGAMHVTMTEAQYNKQIKGKKRVKCDAKKTVFLVPCNAADQKKFKAAAFEYAFVLTSLKTVDSSKDRTVKEMADIVLKAVNGSDDQEKARHLSAASKTDLEAYKQSFLHLK